MAPARIVGLALCLLAAGCAMTGCVAPREPPKDAALPGGTVAVEPPAKTRGGTAAVKPEVGQEQPPVSGSAGQGHTATEAPATRTDAPAPVTEVPIRKAPPAKTEAPAARTDAPAPKIVSPPVKTAARAPAAPPPAAKVTRKESAAPAPVKPPALDLAALEKRLKETSAIGVFTKLTLKNQVDDLLNRFRAYYEGRAKTTLAELRQPYDLLILKVLALLQDGDPSLARAVADSREAMWGILADPAKFKAL
ncbi:MAG: hypothetical protein HY322_02750 [Betaproteobacteria bacterium]|nr:hypothetical protein [Betaproteobacteria bacterium]